jgi:hypothetical protein
MRMTPIGTPELVLLLVALGGMTAAATSSPAPTINGPLSQPAFRGLTGIGE